MFSPLLLYNAKRILNKDKNNYLDKLENKALRTEIRRIMIKIDRKHLKNCV